MRAEAAMIDRREYPRIARPLDARCLSQGLSIPGRVEDLSEGGAYIDTLHPLLVGETLQLVLDLSLAGGEQRKLHLAGEVAWAQPGLGAGVRFIGLRDRDREELRHYVGSVFFGLT